MNGGYDCRTRDLSVLCRGDFRKDSGVFPVTLPGRNKWWYVLKISSRVVHKPREGGVTMDISSLMNQIRRYNSYPKSLDKGINPNELYGSFDVDPFGKKSLMLSSHRHSPS